MTLQVTKVSNAELYETLAYCHDSPFMWHDFDANKFYPESIILCAKRGERLVGIWIVPINKSKDYVIAERSCRIMPYASPWLREAPSYQLESIFAALLNALQEQVDAIDLPLAPNFTTGHVANRFGCFIEWRHTRIFNKDQDIDALISPKVRNHIRSAAKTVKITCNCDPASFDFSRAIIDTPENRALRKAFALDFHRRGVACVFTAETENCQYGAIYLIKDKQSVYLFHSWFDRDGPRGVPSLLLHHAIKWCFRHWKTNRFDFEGSILAKVDYFFSTFGGNVLPYPHLYWASDNYVLIQRLRNSLQIQGRSYGEIKK